MQVLKISQEMPACKTLHTASVKRTTYFLIISIFKWLYKYSQLPLKHWTLPEHTILHCFSGGCFSQKALSFCSKYSANLLFIADPQEQEQAVIIFIQSTSCVHFFNFSASGITNIFLTSTSFAEFGMFLISWFWVQLANNTKTKKRVYICNVNIFQD